MGIIASAAPIEKFEPSQHHAGTVGVVDNAYAATTACHLATGRSSRNFCRDFRLRPSFDGSSLADLPRPVFASS